MKDFRSFSDPHHASVNGPDVDIPKDIAHIRHYFTKSYEDWGNKVKRGRADFNEKRDMQMFFDFNGLDCDTLKKLKGIVITTSDATRDWLPACLNSLKTAPYEVFVQDNGKEGGYELAGISAGKNLFKEFVHLMDTTEVKDISLFDKLFEIDGHVFLTEGGYHYMGKFVSNDLPEIPTVKTKAEAIDLELKWLGKKPRKYFKPDLPVHTEVFKNKNGRRNMILSNEFITKYKATFHI